MYFYAQNKKHFLLDIDYLINMKQNSKYMQFALCREMFETADLIKGFSQNISKKYIRVLKDYNKTLITGEGSSRIFPGKHFKDALLKKGINLDIVVEGATQSQEFDLSKFCVFGASNSGRTKELVSLFNFLKSEKHPYFFGVTATPESQITMIATDSTVLNCGQEYAVAATKSVVEQALFFESLLYNFINKPMPDMKNLAEQVEYTLETSIDYNIVDAVGKAPIIYFAGRNNGVAEELALKTNEITRKKSVFLEGTYALHGIEEVMQAGEVLILVDPFFDEVKKFHDVIQKGTGATIIAISSRKTIFPTILLPQNQDYQNYIELVAGWNILVEVGLSLGIDPDKPVRARKIGNEI